MSYLKGTSPHSPKGEAVREGQMPTKSTLILIFRTGFRAFFACSLGILPVASKESIPATRKMSGVDVFQRLVDIEARHMSCKSIIDRRYPGDELIFVPPKIDAFRTCVKGPPRESCSAPITAVRNAQTFFRRYYQEGINHASIISRWARQCKRDDVQASYAAKERDLGKLCRSSYLIVPIWREKFWSPPLVGWGGSEDSAWLQQCGTSNYQYWAYYKRRCLIIWRVGAVDSGRVVDSDKNALVREYYDDVDWDVCRVLTTGSLTISTANYGRIGN
jgi:hypothetical protein